MRRLLWVGDAAVSTGFARATHYTLDVLRKTWDVSVLGMNYRGDPHEYPYPIFPCWPGGDGQGVGRLVEVVEHVDPEVIVIQQDPWNIPQYMKLLKKAKIATPVVGAIAVDGRNCRGTNLNGLALAIFWTKFGEAEARRGGYTGRSAVVPLGVDLDIYRPQDRAAARAKFVRVGENDTPLELGDAFIVGNINRNQPRKRLDLSIAYFAEWVISRKIPDAYLYLHVAPTGETSLDPAQLMSFFGLKKRLILSVPDDIGHGISEQELVETYATFDVMLTTTVGEGWGLPTMEGMACGIPQIVPQWSALAEWAGDAAWQVPCTEIAVNNVNVIGGVADRAGTIEALDVLYRDPGQREMMRQRGLQRVLQPEYRWPAIGASFADAIDAALAQRPALEERETIPA